MAICCNAFGCRRLKKMERKKVIFRTDASLQIGTGHVMRCLTLADALRDKGYFCLFLCRPHAGHLLSLIAARGHEVIPLQALPEAGPAPDPKLYHAAWLGTSQDQDAADCLQALAGQPMASWLVIDHYALDLRWQRQLRTCAERLMVLDDLADRAHDCDLLLDPGIGRTRNDYTALIPSDAQVLSGPEHALLRPEFSATRRTSLARRQDPQLRRLLVTLGGVDKDNITHEVLEALDSGELPADMIITVVMGPHAPWLSDVTARASTMSRPTTVLTGVSDMARLMSESDLAIGAAGSTAWERCCLGLPTIQLVLAENQAEAAFMLQQVGAVINLPHPDRIGQVLNCISPQKIREMAQAAAAVTAGEGLKYAIREMTL